jgi:hypothetical protein
VVHEHASHHPRRRTVEIRTVLHLHSADVPQPQKGFVHERGRLQRVAFPFVAKMVVGELPELVVDERHQYVEGIDIAAAPAVEQLRDVSMLYRVGGHGSRSRQMLRHSLSARPEIK